jgi:hypothetical protein
MMPTGYTAAIANGITFERYAWDCARAFGALVTMRDDPPNAPIPDEFKASEHHATELASAQRELARIRTMTPAEANEAARQEYNAACASRAKRVKEADDLRAKYEAMLASVRAWEPPSPDHVEYRRFMEQQIVDSIKWDCSVHGDAPKQLTGEEWRKDALDRASWSVEYHAKGDREERERIRTRNEWLRLLRESLAQ